MLRVRVFSVAVQIPNEKEIAPRENDSVSIRCLCAIIIIIVVLMLLFIARNRETVSLQIQFMFLLNCRRYFLRENNTTWHDGADDGVTNDWWCEWVSPSLNWFLDKSQFCSQMHQRMIWFRFIVNYFALTFEWLYDYFRGVHWAPIMLSPYPFNQIFERLWFDNEISAN